MAPLVSVIIPCYNAGKWVGEAVESALRQTHKPLEVIVVDDGSTDNSLEILRSFGNAITLETGPNRGGNAARNRAFSLSSGSYIQYLDADDYILPDKIERQVQFLEETKAHAVYGDWRYQRHLPDGTSFLDKVQVAGSQPDNLASLLGDWWVSPAAILFRREAVLGCGGWDETLKAGQDRAFLIELLLAGATILYQPGCYAVYRQYGRVTVSTSNLPRLLESHYRILDNARYQLMKRGVFSAVHGRAIALSYFNLGRLYYNLDRERSRHFMKEALLLAPDLKPTGSVGYRIVWRLFGFDVAEWCARCRRRVMATLGQALMERSRARG